MPKIAIDPLTRIEGHLRIEAQVENGQVVDAWSTTPMFRGLEIILQQRDPRDAWLFAQRICGVCTTVNALASVRAVEDALGIEIPDNARILRNIIEGAQYVHDHIVHFYHLHGPDWIDITSALNADPVATSALQNSISAWPNNSANYFGDVKARLQKFVNSGQLGLFANAYWGHPAYQLPPESNLLLMAHYLEALDWQREVAKIHAVLGGKNPHPQTYLVGGMAIPIDPNSNAAINPATISTLRDLTAKARTFVDEVYLPDLLHIAGYYKNWANHGAGPGNFLAIGDFPDSQGNLWLPRGIVYGNDLSTFEAVDTQQITEDVTRAWYADGPARYPAQGETNPQYTGPTPPFDFLDTNGKYSWGKAPRYAGQVMEVGPLARLLVAAAAGHYGVRVALKRSLSQLGLPKLALFSTLGRLLARALETQLTADKMPGWIDELENNMNQGDWNVFNGVRWQPQSWPAQAEGYGTTEAPRGALGHWVGIESQKIAHYQIVIPSTWNGSPRDANGQRGAWEEALIGTPVHDPEQPVEILRTIHSFDPCMACAVHVIDSRKSAATRVKVV